MAFDAKAWDTAQAEVTAKMLRARIAALEAQLAQYRWRRVEDEMPAVWESVLVPRSDNCEEAFVDTAGEWWWSHTPDSRCGTVRNWMPLPAAPEEEEE